MHLPAFVLRGEAANTTLWKVNPPFENLDLIDWKTDACWENNTSVEVLHINFRHIKHDGTMADARLLVSLHFF